MPIAKHLSYARSRSPMERPRRIHESSFAEPRALPLQASSPRPAIAAAPVASRSIFKTAAQFAESAGDILLTVATWLLSEILDGCAAYALAMYGLPAAINDEKRGDATPPAPAMNPSLRTEHVILAETEEDKDVDADDILSPDAAQPCAGADSAARSEQTAGALSGWCMAIIAPAVLLLSRICEGSARRRMIAELRRMDDRSLRDIGISRTDIGYIARHGVRPE